MIDHAVIIVGAGPTGLMLAGELALAGVDVAIVERRADQALAGSRAKGLSCRTLEMLDQRGIVDRFLAAGQIAQVAGFGMTRLDISDFPTRHNYGLALHQQHIERILAEWVEELEVPTYFGREVATFSQSDTGVEVSFADGGLVHTQYLVGCDGGRSVVRKTAGIEFAGWDATTSSILAEVEMTEMPPMGVHHSAYGVHAFGRNEYEIRNGKIIYKDTGPIGVMVTEKHAIHTDEPTLDDVREILMAVCGTDYGMHNLTWISRFTDMSRQAVSYRQGRVLLAGDAAHVHSPIGGQGLNTGLQDAMNLGWKLAQVVNGTSPDSFLDSYHAERYPVGARVLKNTMAQVALHRPDDRSKALQSIMTEVLGVDAIRKQFAAMMTGLDIRYDFGAGHPLLGRRMPDLDISTHAGVVRVFTLLRAARPVLINFGERDAFDIALWADRVLVVDAKYDGTWDLPAVGVVPFPTAVLVRPDGYVAWVGDNTREGLSGALLSWAGTPPSAS